MTLPSTSNLNNPGNRDDYNVNCFQIGYCDLGASGPSGWEIGFYNSYAPCSGAATADALVDASGLPSGGCWLVTIDLSGGNEICLQADGDGSFSGTIAADTFGWSYRYTGSSAGAAGFLLNGDPQSTDPNWVVGGGPVDGTNTYFGPPSNCSPTEATGLFTQDQWFLEDSVTPANSGCYWFGGYRNINGCGGPSNPYASWSMEIQADTAPCGSGPISYCLSNPNSTGVNSTMTITGSPSIAANNVTLTASLPINSFGFFVTSQDQGFIANPAGSAGNICLSGSVGRFQQLASNSGTSGQISISTLAGQWSLSSIPQGSAPYAATVGGAANFQLWHRDSSPTGPTSNFTDAVTVTWLP